MPIFTREPFRQWLIRLEELIATSGSGTVGGPVSSTLRAVARWGDTAGLVLTDSLVTVSDAGSISLPNGQTVGGVDVSVLGAAVTSHAADVANPHAVTKTQVGLSAVTNDAQLTRAADDWGGFSSKTPIGADRVLIEDSAAAGAKKKALVSDLVTLGTNYVESAQGVVSTDITRTATSFADMTGATVTMTLTAGDILLIIADVSAFNTGGIIFVQLVVDGVAVLQSASSNNGSGNIALVWRASGLSAGSRVVKLQWKVNTGTAQCLATTSPDTHHCVLNVERVRV